MHKLHTDIHHHISTCSANTGISHYRQTRGFANYEHIREKAIHTTGIHSSLDLRWKKHIQAVAQEIQPQIRHFAAL